MIAKFAESFFFFFVVLPKRNFFIGIKHFPQPFTSVNSTVHLELGTSIVYIESVSSQGHRGQVSTYSHLGTLPRSLHRASVPDLKKLGNFMTKRVSAES